MLIRKKICTNRLRLHPAIAADVPKLHELWKDPDVRKYLWDDRNPDPDEVATMIATSDKGFRTGRGGLWIVDDLDGKFVGCAGLREADWQQGDVEVLYGLAPAFWGHGYATEAAIAVLEHGFTNGLDPIVAAADVPNEASARVLARLGMQMTREGDLDGVPTRFYALDRTTFERSQLAAAVVCDP